MARWSGARSKLPAPPIFCSLSLSRPAGHGRCGGCQQACFCSAECAQSAAASAWRHPAAVCKALAAAAALPGLDAEQHNLLRFLIHAYAMRAAAGSDPGAPRRAAPDAPPADPRAPSQPQPVPAPLLQKPCPCATPPAAPCLLPAGQHYQQLLSLEGEADAGSSQQAAVLHPALCAAVGDAAGSSVGELEVPPPPPPTPWQPRRQLRACRLPGSWPAAAPAARGHPPARLLPPARRWRRC
jgi:hypothetical protein